MKYLDEERKDIRDDGSHWVDDLVVEHKGLEHILVEALRSVQNVNLQEQEEVPEKVEKRQFEDIKVLDKVHK